MKRFYKQASAVAAGGGWQVALDGRLVKTVGGRAQVVPSAALAQALAEEWEGQGEEIDATAFVLRDMVDFALDVVAQDPAESLHAILPYAETDTLCYRAEPDEPLFARQQAVWEQVLQGAEARYGLRFERVSGIIHRAQPADTLTRLQDLLVGYDAFELAALRNLTSLAASLVIALLALERDADLPALWAAASLEEQWQADLWGRDWEAEERRSLREAAFMAAARLVVLARG